MSTLLNSPPLGESSLSLTTPLRSNSQNTLTSPTSMTSVSTPVGERHRSSESPGIGIGGGGGSNAHPLQQPTPPTRKPKKTKRSQEVVDEDKSDSEAEPSAKKRRVLQSRDQEVLSVAKAQKAKGKLSKSKKGMILHLFSIFILTEKYLTTCHI